MLFAALFSSCAGLDYSAREKDTQDYIIKKKQKEIFYKDYKRIVILEMVYFDDNLQKNFLADYQNISTNKKDLVKEKNNEVFLALVSLQNNAINLEKKDTEWSFFWKREDQKNYEALMVKKIKPSNLYYQFLQKYYSIDNWTDLYLLKIPKSSKKNSSIEIKLASLQGKIVMSW